MKMEVFIKYGVGLAGVLIGAFLAPWIEERKNKKHGRLLVDDIYTELNDFLSESSNYIAKTHEAYRKVFAYHNVKTIPSRKIYPLTIVKPISLYLLEKHHVELLRHISSTERKTFKIILLSLESINFKINFFRSKDKIDDDDKPQEYLALLHEICLLKNNIRKLLSEKENFSWPKESDDEIVKIVLAKLNLSVSPQDIMASFA